MRKILTKTERVQFVCDNEDCKSSMIETFKDKAAEVPLGWVQFISHDVWISIEGKTCNVGIEIQACSGVCMHKALEALIDKALDSE